MDVDVSSVLVETKRPSRHFLEGFRRFSKYFKLLSQFRGNNGGENHKLDRADRMVAYAIALNQIKVDADYTILQEPKTKPEEIDLKKYKYSKGEDRIFFDCLTGFMIDKNLTDVETYNRSGVTKAAFSRMRCIKTKIPTRETVMGFCIGLNLNQPQANSLMLSAGYAFNPKRSRDRLVSYCIQSKKKYDILTVNDMLDSVEQPLIGGSYK